MAEYKYRALGWKDDDIASLNVVDGTADNQVELQITKQGAGTIDGPAIVGKDGITIDKAADSEKIEISGKGCVQHHTGPKGYTRAYVTDSTNWDTTIIVKSDGTHAEYTLMQRKPDGSGEIVMPETPVDLSITNKKYVDDNYVKKATTSDIAVYALNTVGDTNISVSWYGNNTPGNIIVLSDKDQKVPGDNTKYTGDIEPRLNGTILVPEPTRPYHAANKKYVDDNYVKKVKFTNLEQALNGYILDTTKEAYADLDSAVLKNSVAVGDNVYPIADKTRALVTRIEGKTTKMVQLLDKSTFPATSTPIAGITVTKTDDGGLHVLGTSASSGGRNSWGITVNVEKGHKYLSLLKGNNKITSPFVTLKSDTSQYVGFVADITTSTFKGECDYGFNFVEGDYDETIYPQLFDLTAMNREDITSVEQFKAEFPEFYPYENGNIYPAKISGVKFTGKNLFNINQFEDYKQNDTSGIKVINDKISITGYPVNLPNNHYFSNLIRILKPNTQYAISVNISNYISDSSGQIVFVGKNNYTIKQFPFTRNGYSSGVFSLTQEDIDTFDYVRIYGNNNTKPPIIMTNLQIEENSAPTAYEPYTEPVSVTLPETYDLHGIGDYKDYLEITKNENNELYTLKKVQNVEVNESEKTITPLATPVETVIATNLTYEQVTAIRHNGGLIEVEGNTNKGYARPTVTNTIVYRLTAANTAEG